MLTNLCSIHFLLLPSVKRILLSLGTFFSLLSLLFKQVRILLSPVYFFKPLIIATNHLIVGWLEIPGIPNELFQVPGNQTLPDFPTALSWVEWTPVGLASQLLPPPTPAHPYWCLVPWATLSSPPRPTHHGSWARRGICSSAVQKRAHSSCSENCVRGTAALFWLAWSEQDAPALSSHVSTHVEGSPAVTPGSAWHSRALAGSAACRWGEFSADIWRNFVLPGSWEPRHQKKSTLSAFPKQHNNTTQAPWLHKAPVNVA